jgi:hypothetical protein
VVSSLPALGSVLPEMGSALATVGSELARPGSLAAGHGQFRWRSWSVGVAKAGKWLAFCTGNRQAAAMTGIWGPGVASDLATNVRGIAVNSRQVAIQLAIRHSKCISVVLPDNKPLEKKLIRLL